MPRPGTDAKKTQGSNPITGWWKERQRRKDEKRETEAEEIINDAAHFEGLFRTELQGIAFAKSPLPKEQLEYKSNPNQKYGDLEYTALWLQNKLATNTAPVSMDIRKLDQQLHQIVRRYKEAIEQGYLREAYAGRAALLKCFQEIRFKLPQVLPLGTEEAFARNYIDQCVNYVKCWYDLLDQAKHADLLERNLRETQKLESVRYDEHQQMLDELGERISHDNAMAQIYLDLSQGKAATTPEAKKLNNEIIEAGTKNTVLTAVSKAAELLQLQLTQSEGRVDILLVAANSIPIPQDPNLMNRFNEDVAHMQESFAKADQEIEESINVLNNIDGAIAALEDLPGAVAVRNKAAATIDQQMTELQKRQAGVTQSSDAAAFLRDMYGIKTPQELEEAKRQMEEQQAIIFAEATNDNRQTIVNED